MGVGRIRLANPQPLIALKPHRYQIAFMQARRLRVCTAGHQWQYAYDGGLLSHVCPKCGSLSQRAFRYFLLRAGRRGGKTRIGAVAGIEEATVPNSAGWATTATYPMLEDFVLPAFFKQIPQSWLDDPRTDWSESEYTLILPNKAMVQFRSLEDPDRARGPGLDWWWVDESNLLTRKHLETGRPMLSDRIGILLLTSTPRGWDFIHEDYFLRAEAGRPGYWAAHYASVDNPGMTADEIAEARDNMTDLMFRQEYLAEIVSFTGSIYGDILGPSIIAGTDAEMRHYFPEWPNIDPSRPSITALDPGTDHPFAGICLVASPRGLVAVGEYAQPGRKFQMHAQSIHAMRKGDREGLIGIDRSQAQAQIELMEYGLATVAAENDVIAGINRVSAWMLASGRNRINDLPTGLVLPRSVVPLTIRQLQAYRWADNTNKDGSTKHREMVYKRDDDLPDALRYALMTYPTLPGQDPIAAPKSRDLLGMPANARMEIERMRRIEAAERAQHEAARASDTYDTEGSEGWEGETVSSGYYAGFN